MAMNHKLAMHFAARDAEALERAQRRQESPLTAATSKFSVDFGDAKQDILSKLNNASSVSEANATEYFDQLLRLCQELQKLVSSAAGYLSKFDLRQAQKDVSDIQAEVHALQGQIIPRKRFAFKSRTRQQASTSVDSVSQTGSVGSGSTTLESIDGTDLRHQPVAEGGSSNVDLTGGANFQDVTCGRSDLTNEAVLLEHDEVVQQDVMLARLKRCCVRIHGAPSTLRLVDLQNCTILCGPVATSVFLEKCENCSLVFACQQMRMHESTSCDVYLHVTSRAIIEDCSAIRVAPYNYLYEQLSDHFELSGLNRQCNNWQSVDDFKWLSSTTPSPNWSVLPESKRSISWRTPPADRSPSKQ
ncbi:tubulin-specific chaperone C-like [Sycon ciliatum]|uniref:tubulin-specific chaperone C-like n=1 Tax=Sycon ciliatum TaxID=27933 RepID=UPI0031F70A19